jgi:Na+/H+-dicarboxylate symporter
MDGQLDWAREGVRFMSNFTMNVVQTVSLLLPFLVCISTIKMVMQLGIIGLWAYGRMLLVIALGLPLSFCVAALLILLVARCSPLPFLQKTVPFSALPFSSSNSSACLPATLKFCVEKLMYHVPNLVKTMYICLRSLPVIVDR